jgi:hypothetical protein
MVTGYLFFRVAASFNKAIKRDAKKRRALS